MFIGVVFLTVCSVLWRVLNVTAACPFSFRSYHNSNTHTHTSVLASRLDLGRIPLAMCVFFLHSEMLCYLFMHITLDFDPLLNGATLGSFAATAMGEMSAHPFSNTRTPCARTLTHRHIRTHSRAHTSIVLL